MRRGRRLPRAGGFPSLSFSVSVFADARGVDGRGGVCACMRRGTVAVEQHNGIRHIIRWRSPRARLLPLGRGACTSVFAVWRTDTAAGPDPAHVCFIAFQLSVHGLNLGACAGVQGCRRATLGETPCVLGADDGRCERRPSERVQHRSRGLDTPLTSLLSIRGRRRGRRGPRYRWATYDEPAAPPRLGTPANRTRRVGSTDSRGAQNRGRSRHDGGALLHPRHRAHTRVYGHYFPFGGLSAPAPRLFPIRPPGKLAREDIYI